MHKLMIIPVLVSALFFRLMGVNWDESSHLHPDERYITFVGTSVKLPDSFGAYIDPERSTLNPQSTKYKKYVYGILPVTLNKILVTVLGARSFNDFNFYGRILSASFDFGTCILVFLIALQLQRYCGLAAEVKYFAALAYAAAVLPIQHSHFLVTDTFLVFFSTAALYFALLFFLRGWRSNLVLSAVSLGAGFACKLSALYVLPLVALLVVSHVPLQLWRVDKVDALLRATLAGLLLIVFCYLTWRMLDPYVFASANPFDPTFDSEFQKNIMALMSYSSFEGASKTVYPPALQWFNKPAVLFSFGNLAVFGLGLPLTVLAGMGGAVLAQTRKFAAWLILLWALTFFLYSTCQFVKAGRYLLVLYPWLSIAAGAGASFVIREVFPPRLSKITSVVLIFAILAWPALFTRIYRVPHTRLEASRWMYDNMPDNSVILLEEWDDLLPVNSLPRTKNFKIMQMPSFQRDDNLKWAKMDNLLKQANYIVLSSNRGYGSIEPLPDRYPRMSNFYRDLFNAELPFKQAKEFTSYPGLQLGKWKLEINDQWAEEAFSVYDHPRVVVFRKQE